MDGLSEAHCRRLLASTPVGRVVYTDQALPAIAVVNHRVRGDDIVFRADDGGRLAAALHRSVVAFEADAVDPETAVGWSVVAVGEALRVAGTAELESLADLGLRTWFGPAAGGDLIRIRIQLLTGHATGGSGSGSGGSGDSAAGHRAVIPLVSG
ncbi:pyridoxamine 5'-phosphate oxidase family protein [Microlunatus sp. GCM10028923]